MSLYPFKFVPKLLEKMWGGRKLESLLGKKLPQGKQIGESWELYDFPPGAVEGEKGWVSAQIASGPLAGRTLHDLIGEFGRDILGDVALLPEGQFPILTKFLDARDDLSVQVHPDEHYAATHPGAFLKNEAWYIMQADPGSRLLKGLKPDVTRDAFEASLKNGNGRIDDHIDPRQRRSMLLPQERHGSRAGGRRRGRGGADGQRHNLSRVRFQSCRCFHRQAAKAARC